MAGSRKYKERGRVTRRMFTSKWEKLQGQRVPPGGARAVLAEGAEKGGMNGTLERPKDFPCFSLGDWKVSREWRARDKPILHYWKINSFLVYQTHNKTYLLNTAFAAVGPAVQLPLPLIRQD